MTQPTSDQLVCVQAVTGSCRGVVARREPLSGTGRSFPRCDLHWDQRLQLQRELSHRYPVSPPADWSPLDAGEAWDEDDY